MTKDRWNEGYDCGFHAGKLAVYEDLLKIKYSRWSLVSLNGKDWKPDEIYMTDYLIKENKDKPLKIVYPYEICDVNNNLITDHIVGRAKNRTIGEIWKAIDKMMIKYCDSTGESLFGDHRFIESIDYKHNQIKFYTGS